MLFLAVLETLLLVVLAALVIAVVRLLSADRPQAGLRAELLLLCIGLASGSVAVIYLLDLRPTPTIRADAVNLSPWFLLACGLCCAIGFGVRLLRLSRSLRSAHATGLRLSFRFGVSTFAVLASVYFAFTAIDHWWLLRGTDAGVAAPQALGAVDVECPLVLFRVTEQDALYRCPTSAMFNQRYTKPFLPWPLYTAGHSPMLKEKYDEMKRSVTGQ